MEESMDVNRKLSNEHFGGALGIESPRMSFHISLIYFLIVVTQNNQNG